MPVNVPSLLLSDEENAVLFSILGPRSNTRSSAIVQVYRTSAPSFSEWIFLHCGVATFTKDSNKKSFFIQVYDIEEKVKVFEQELYENFEYFMNPVFFHQFEGENGVVGLNFADETEASFFGETILKFVERKKNPGIKKPGNTQTTSESPLTRVGSRTEEPPSTLVLRGNKKSVRRIRKSQIGNPENFRHIQHVGLGSPVGGGPSTLSEDTLLACIMDMSNIRSNELTSPEDKQSFLKYIEENGGARNVYKKLKKISGKRFGGSSSTPSIAKQDSNHREVKRIPPQPPSEERKATTTAPPPPPKTAPTVPLAPKPTLKKSETVYSPPPPPPPAPPPSMKPKVESSRKHSANLQLDIANEKPKSGLCEAVSPAREDFLRDIRNFKAKLNPVEEKPKPMGKTCTVSSNFVVNSLAKALEDRGHAFRGESDSDYDSSTSENEDFDDDDWD